VTACILWAKSRSSKGYGAAYYEGRQIGAHRLAWILAHGPIPPGMNVCHRCDNPPCVNVDHLFLGTPGDNNRDTVAKGRHRGHDPSNVVEGMKPCRACGHVKPVSDFSPNGLSRRTGRMIYHPRCKVCRRK
jgi:hypothetical protein